MNDNHGSVRGYARASRLARGFGRVLGALGVLGALAMGALSSSCSLGNIAQDPCTSDEECTAVFGEGSVCESGYCSGGIGECASVADCRAANGHGSTCESGNCVVAPAEARCTLSEPPELIDGLPGLLKDRFVMGAMFKLGTEKEAARANAVRLAVREMNGQKGIGGTPLGVVICDTDGLGAEETDAEETEAITRYLAGSLGVSLILGPSSSEEAAFATNALLNAKLASAIITPSATSPSLTDLVDRFNTSSDPYGLLWRTCPSDAMQGEVLAEVIDKALVTEMNMSPKVAVLYQNDIYGNGLEEVFRASWKAMGAGHGIGSFRFDINGSDLDQAVSDAAADPDVGAVVVITSDAARTVMVLDKASAAGTLSALPFFLTDGSKDSAVLLSAANSAGVKAIVAGAHGTAPANPSGTSYDTFALNFQDEFKTDPSAYSFLAQSYDAAYAGAIAIAYASGVTPAFNGFHVAEGLAHLSEGESVSVGPTGFTKAVGALLGQAKMVNIVGTSGALNFDPETGEAPGPIEVWSVNMNQFVTDSVKTP